MSTSSQRPARERRAASDKAEAHVSTDNDRRAAGRFRAVAAAAAGVIGAGSREALRAILEDACREVLPFDAFFVQGYEPRSHTFHGFGGTDAGLESPRNVVPAAGTPGERVVRERKSLLTLRSEDPAAQGGHLTGTGRRSESVIRSPILSGEDVLGILSVHSYTPNLYTEEDVEVVEVIASLAATALENLRLADRRKEAEMALRERERQLREAQRIARLGSWRWKVGSDTVTWSEEMFHAYGMTPTASGQVHFADFVDRLHPEDRPVLMEQINEARRTGEPYETLHRVIRPDGEQRTLLARGEAIRDADGAVVEMFGSGQDVTEAQAAEELLRNSEESYRTMFELASDAMFVHDTESGAVLDANRKALELHGCSLKELKQIGIGGISDGQPPYDGVHAREYVRRAAAGEPQRFEWVVRRKSGQRIWVEVSLQLVRILGVPRVLASVRNIDERKNAEAELQRAHEELEQRVQARTEALRASEESYRGLFDNLTDLVYVQALDGTFLNVNEAVLREYGYTREELVGSHPGLLAAPGRVDVEEVMNIFKKAVAGEPQRFQWWGLRKDGTIFPKEVVLKRSTYFGEDVVIAVGRNVSERVEAEEALRRSERHFRRLIENASDLISILDMDGTIRYESPAITRMLGYTPDELVGKNAFDYLAPEDVAPTMQRIEKLLRRPDRPVFAEFRFRHKNGTWCYIESVGMPLNPDAPQEGLIVNSRDITERKRTESTLRLQKTLLEAQGEASIDGILVVADNGKILSYNQQFVDLWSIPDDVIASRSDEAAIQAVIDQLADPASFQERVEYLYRNPHERARDEVPLKDGRVFDRYSSPVESSEGDYYGRIWFFRDVTDRKRHEEELEQARQEAEMARVRASRYAKSLERELEFGRQIQQGLLPASLPEARGWEISVRFSPVWQVAGDFYDAFELPTGHIGLIIADVSGKGVGAALFMALFQSLLRASAERAGSISTNGVAAAESILGDAVKATNSYITRVHRHAHMFASVFFGLLDPKTGRLDFVNAGHEKPVMVRRDGSLERLDTTGPALGLLSEASYEVERTRLSTEDVLVAFTDGVTEARSEGRDFFTEERLLGIMREPSGTAAQLLDRIEEAVKEFTGDAAPSDDLTLLAVRRTA